VEINRDRADMDKPGVPPPSSLRLGIARIISAMMYLGSLAAYIVVGLVVKPASVIGIPGILPWLLLAVAIADYGVSLGLEGVLLRGKGWSKSAPGAAPRTAEGRASTTAIIVSAFGVSIAVYGVVIALLSFAKWPWLFYGLCLLHGIHLQLRWDRYEEAASRGPS